MKKLISGWCALIFACILLIPSAAIAGGGGEYWTVFKQYLPESFFKNLQAMFGPSFVEGNESIQVTHVLLTALVFIVGVGLMVAASRRMKREDDYLLPSAKWNAFAFFDVMIEALLEMMERMMPREKALQYLPLITAFACFILISNLMALVPGLYPPTQSLSSTFALGLVVFVMYNYWGVREQGAVKHFGHLMGPIPWLAPLMLPIEIVSHVVRPCSLALRLMGNMYGDHSVLAVFLSFNIIFVPLPVMVLGTLVCVVQTLVFTLLAIVYIAMAVESHDDHGHAEAH